MRDHAIPLHLTESQSSVSRSTLSWLSSQDLSRTSAARVHLVINHVFESLVESWTKEDHDLHLFASEPIVHDFVTSHLVA